MPSPMPVNTERALPRYADQILNGDEAGQSNHVLLTSGAETPRDGGDTVVLRPRPDRPGLGTRVLAAFYCLPLIGRVARRAHEAVASYEGGCAVAQNFRSTIGAILQCREEAPAQAETVPLLSRRVRRLPPEGGLLTVGEAAGLVRRARDHISAANEERLAGALFPSNGRASPIARWMLPNARERWHGEAPQTRDFFLVATLQEARAEEGFASRMLTPADVDLRCAKGGELYEAFREAMPGARLDAQCLEGIVVRGKGLAEQTANLVADVQARLAERAGALEAERAERSAWGEGVHAALAQCPDLNADIRAAFSDMAAALPLAPALVAPCLQMVEEVTDELSCFSDSVLYGAPLPADVCERARLALDRGLARIVTAAVAAGVAFDPVANRAWACELCARVGYANEGISDMDEPNLRLVRHFQQHVLGTPVTP